MTALHHGFQPAVKIPDLVTHLSAASKPAPSDGQPGRGMNDFLERGRVRMAHLEAALRRNPDLHASKAHRLLAVGVKR